MTDKFLNRIYYPDKIAIDQNLILQDEQFHYLSRVLKAKKGDLVILFNSNDGEFSSEITDVSKNKIILRIKEKIRNVLPIKTKINLLIGCIKPERMKLIIEKSVELGVTNINILRTDFSFHNYNHEKYTKIAIEATEQSDRICVPEINSKMSNFKDVITKLSDKSLNLFADERRNCPNLISILTGNINVEEYNLIIGPEGGFSKEERNLIDSNENILKFKLSNNILRTETAVIASLAILLNFSGE